MDVGSPATPTALGPLQHFRSKGTVQKFSTELYPAGGPPPVPQLLVGLGAERADGTMKAATRDVKNNMVDCLLR